MSFEYSSAHNEQPAVYDPEGPCIFAPDSEKMRLIIEQPHLIDSIIDTSTLQIRCTRCALTQSLCEAGFVSCKHCYKYYCSRACRVADWDRHRDRCSFARINTLCKEVIMKVRRDHETQFQMSKVAREGFVREGRGSVNIRLMSAHFAQRYLADGWRAFANEDPNHLLFYYSIPRLIEQRKEPSIVQLCKRYNPNEKFILSVSIIADIECCPETPPPEPSRDAFESSSAAAAESDDNGAQPPRPPRTLSRFSNTSASTVARQPAYASRARHAGGMAYGGAVVPTNV